MQELTKFQIFNTLTKNKDKINQLGIKRVGLFGSYVRNQQTDKSDIDLYIEFYPDKENFDNFINLCFLFDNLFENKKVEVVTENGLSPYIGPQILKEVEYVKITD